MCLATVALACSTDTDCNLNGKCVTGSCQCVSFWGGPDCGQVQFLPAASANGAALLPSSNQSRWCAGVQFDATDKAWHLYSALMTDNCGLNSWTQVRSVPASASVVVVLSSTQFVCLFVCLFFPLLLPLCLSSTSFSCPL